MSTDVGTYLRVIFTDAGSTPHTSDGVAYLDTVNHWYIPASAPPCLCFCTSVSHGCWCCLSDTVSWHIPAGFCVQQDCWCCSSGPGKLVHTCTHSSLALVPHKHLVGAGVTYPDTVSWYIPAGVPPCSWFCIPQDCWCC